MSFVLTSCNIGASAPPPDGADLATAAALTVEAALTPAATPTAAQSAGGDASPTAASTAADCEDVAQVTAWTRDGLPFDAKEVENRLAPDKSFVMSWILQNSGTCTWTNDYKFIFDSGDRITVPDTFPVMPVGYTVAPGASLTVSIQMTAPAAPGEYETTFSMIDADGKSMLTVGVPTKVGTNSTSGKLPAPGDLRYEYDCTSGSVQISLTWTDNASNEDGYRVYRDGTKLTDLPADSTSYVDIAPASGSYDYSVTAYNASGESKASVNAKTTNCQ